MRRIFPALFLLACSKDSSTPDPAPATGTSGVDGGGTRILVFNKWTSFYHDSIPAGTQALHEIAREANWVLDDTADATVFSDAGLAPYKVVVFLSTSVENDDEAPFGGPGQHVDATIMTPDQKSAFERYIAKGGAYVGIHSASDGDYKWPFYVALVGAMWKNHPLPPGTYPGRIIVADQKHPSTDKLGAEWQRTEEWYNFKDDPSGRVHVLLTIDESSYPETPKMGFNHPIAWCQVYGGGKSFYTALGHAKEAFGEPLLRQHLRGGIEWAAGLRDGDCSHP